MSKSEDLDTMVRSSIAQKGGTLSQICFFLMTVLFHLLGAPSLSEGAKPQNVLKNVAQGAAKEAVSAGAKGAENSTDTPAETAEFKRPTDSVPNVLPETGENEEEQTKEEAEPEELVNLAWPPGARFDRVEGGKIVFSAPKGYRAPDPIETQLHDLEYKGELYPQDGEMPYILMSGLPCVGCTTHKALYLIRADGRNPMQLTYPGQVRHRKTGRLTYDGKAFFGECIPGKSDVFLMLQKEKVDRRRYLQHSAFIAEVFDSHVHEQIVVRGRPTLRRTRKQVRKKKCQEIAGFNRRSVRFDRALSLLGDQSGVRQPAQKSVPETAPTSAKSVNR